MDIAHVTERLVDSVGSDASSRVADLIRGLVHKDTKARTAFRRISTQSTDAQAARVVQRALIKQALSDPAVARLLNTAYLEVEPDPSPQGGGASREITLEISDTKVVDADTLAKLHALAITTLPDLVGAISASKAGLAETLKMSPDELETVKRSALELLEPEVRKRLTEAVPKRSYGLKLPRVADADS